MIYRTADPEDTLLLAEMNRQLIQDQGHRNPMDLDALASRMRKWLAGEYTVVMFEHMGDCCGYALYRDESEHVYLRHFFVRPAFRRKGIGKRAMQWLRENPWRNRRVRVEVLIGNQSGVAFWRSVGFQEYSLSMELEPQITTGA